MNEKQLERLLGKLKQTGSWEEDLLEFGRLVITETLRLRMLDAARHACLENGGHHFQIPNNVRGEWTIENASTTYSGWRTGANCQTCDAWMVIKYEESE